MTEHSLHTGGWDLNPDLSDWTLDVCAFIRSIDRNHLIIDGTLGTRSQHVSRFACFMAATQTSSSPVSWQMLVVKGSSTISIRGHSR